MNIKNLTLLSLTAVLALSSCGKKDDKKEDPKNATELNGVWGAPQVDGEDGIGKIYLEFLNDKNMKIHLRCAFNDGAYRHAIADIDINVNEKLKTVSLNSAKKFSDNDENYICEDTSEIIENIPYELTSINKKKVLDFGGAILLQGDLKEKLKRKTFDETTQHFNPFVSTEISVIAK